MISLMAVRIVSFTSAMSMVPVFVALACKVLGRMVEVSVSAHFSNMRTSDLPRVRWSSALIFQFGNRSGWVEAISFLLVPQSRQLMVRPFPCPLEP